MLLLTSKAGGTLTFHGKLNEELKLELVPNFQSNCFIEIYELAHSLTTNRLIFFNIFLSAITKNC